MKILMWVGVMVFTAAGAASSAELESPDYGACPKTYVEKAKAEFKSGLLTRYRGEPTVWPPRRFSYRTSPREGGHVLAGYLVPVRVDQSAGPQNMPLGVQPWALLFKNEEIVRKFSPTTLEDLAIPAPVLSVPKDERTWTIGDSGEVGNITFQEWVVAGETAKNWTEMVIAETHSNQPTTIAQYLAVKHGSLRRRCANVREEIVSGGKMEGSMEIVVERSLLGCAARRDEYHIARVVVAPRSITNFAYVRTTPFDIVVKERWLEILGRARVLGDC